METAPDRPFQDALARHVDSSKPDPLARGQMERLSLAWSEERAAEDEDGNNDLSPSQSSCDYADQASWDLTRRGTLTLSSEYISVAINVTWKFNGSGADDADGGEGSPKPLPRAQRRFDNEFYLRIAVTASFVPISEHGASIKDETLDRKERSARRKLRAGMLKRMRSDALIKPILVDEGSVLCEALIQQNRHARRDAAGSKSSAMNPELEERVNVQESTLEAVRHAIFSHTEDNLDVLDILLSMPYLPRSSSRGGGGSGVAMDGTSGNAKYATALSTLADRAYLRLLEDAMFDACEREGEDEMLDDLNISDGNGDADGDDTDDDCTEDNRKNSRGKGGVKRRCGSKR